jgi:hypothetical protein
MAYLTIERLITEDGEVDPAVYRAMVRRRCENEHGGISPRAMRAAVAHYSQIIRVLQRRATQCRE